MRAIFFLTGYLGFLLASVFVAHVGPWGYLFEWHNHPPHFWWGKTVPDIVGGRWSFAIGLAMGIGLILNYSKFSDVKVMSHPQSKLIVLYTINAFLVSIFSYDTSLSYAVAIEHVKSFFVFYCVAKTQSNPRHLDVLLLIVILGLILWGWDVTMSHSGGRSIQIGGPSTTGENFVGAHAVAIIPLIAWFALTRTGWIRWAAVLGMPFVVNLIAIGRSRGAMLALAAVFVITIIVTKGKMRKWAFLGSLLGAILLGFLVNEEFVARLNTIKNYEEDGSANGRIIAWNAAYTLAKKNPFGYGGEAFDHGLGAQYMDFFHTTHNMFFEILVAWGVQGVLLMYGFIYLTLRDCRHIFRNKWDGKSWPIPYETMVAIAIFTGLCGMLVASSFLNRYRWEFWWILGAVVIVLKNHVVSSEKGEYSPMKVNNYSKSRER